MGLPIICGIGLINAGCKWFLLNGDMCRGYIAFFMGVLAAMACKKMTGRQVAWYAIPALMTFAIIYKYYNGFFYSGELLNRVLTSLVLLYAPLLMIFTKSTLLDNIFGNPGISWLGKISYELCALNFPFYVWVEILNRRYNLNIPYGRVPAYYIQVVIQIILAAGIHFLAKAIRKKLAATTTAKPVEENTQENKE